MLRDLIKKEMKEHNLKLAKYNKQVFNYVFSKTQSRERAIIPANRYSNTYHINKYTDNTLKRIMSRQFLYKLPDMDLATDILKEHIDNNSTIYQVIDYDVDGISSGAVSHLIFKNIFKYKKHNTIVNKRKWGNGVNDTIIQQLLEIHKTKPIGLVITSDHGSSDGNRIQQLRDAGIDVIVTDHHIPNETNSPLGIANAFVNHKRSDSMFLNDITGTGVIYFTLFHYALKHTVHDIEMINQFYDIMPFVGLTVISDSVDMSDWVNRKLVKYTLNVLNSKRKLGHFWEVVRSEIMGSWFIDQEFISFNLIARLNSPGRIGDPTLTFKLMTADTHSGAKELLAEVTALNEKRKDLQSSSMKNLDEELIGKDTTIAYKKDIAGIQGIIASKLLFKNRSSITFCFTDERDGTLSGSGRSISESLSLIYILDRLKNKDYIIRYGGHAGACGVEIKKGYIKDFFNDVNNAMSNMTVDTEHYIIDDIITNSKVIYKTFMANIAELPYGQKYAQPLYISKFVLTNKRIISKNGNMFLVGNVKLVTEDGLSDDEYKILYTVTTEEERTKLLTSNNEELTIVYNIGVNKFRENKLNVTAEKIFYPEG